MALLDIPPGVSYTVPRRKPSSSWREVNLMRWNGATLKPVGGWEKLNYTAFASTVRRIHKWITNDGTTMYGYLCEEHVYVDKGDGVLQDITPTTPMVPVVSGTDGGYGDGLYSADLYGTPRMGNSRLSTFGPAYSIDNWGEDLIVMTSSDGRLLRWLPSTPTVKCVAVPGAPVNNRSFEITPERFVILFGMGGKPWEFGWCDQEDIGNWKFSDIKSKAGFLPVEPRAPIVAHKITANGLIVWTNRAIGVVTFVGLPFIYGYTRVSDSPTPYSPASIVETPAGVIWPATDGFWVYDGGGVRGIECPVWEWISERINQTASIYNSAIVHISSLSEAWWFFAESGDDAAKNNVYVMYDYRESVWAMGTLARTCGLSYPNDRNPLMSDGKFVYKHETGWEYPGAPALPFAETFTLQFEQGKKRLTIKQMLPEIGGDSSLIAFRFIKRENPNAEGVSTTSSDKRVRTNGYVDVRETARDFRMRIAALNTGYWDLGPIDLELIGRGDK